VYFAEVECFGSKFSDLLSNRVEKKEAPSKVSFLIFVLENPMIDLSLLGRIKKFLDFHLVTAFSTVAKVQETLMTIYLLMKL